MSAHTLKDVHMSILMLTCALHDVKSLLVDNQNNIRWVKYSLPEKERRRRLGIGQCLIHFSPLRNGHQIPSITFDKSNEYDHILDVTCIMN